MISSDCWGSAADCTGGSPAAPGPGQISCSQDGARCNEEYEICVLDKEKINVCIANFASANANVSVAKANAVESSSTSVRNPDAASLSTISSTSSTSSTILYEDTQIRLTKRVRY